MLSTTSEIIAESIIDAPIEEVWKILIDFEKYSEWNEFTAKIVIGSENSNEQQPTIGDNVDLYVKWLGSEKTFKQVERLNQYDSGKKVLEWGMSLGTSWMLKAKRVQTLEVVDGNKTKYTSYGAYEGVLTSIIMKMHRENIQRGFQHAADALKKRCELMK